VEVPSPVSGVIKATHGKPGDRVATGALLVEFELDGDCGTVVGRMPTSDEEVRANFTHNGGNSFADSQHAVRQAAHVRAIPAARALAKRLGVDLTRIRGTGRGLLVTVDDVLHASAAGRSQEAPGVPASVAPAGVELRGLRRAMAQSMALARDNVMACTLFDD